MATLATLASGLHALAARHRGTRGASLLKSLQSMVVNLKYDDNMFLVVTLLLLHNTKWAIDIAWGCGRPRLLEYRPGFAPPPPTKKLFTAVISHM